MINELARLEVPCDDLRTMSKEVLQMKAEAIEGGDGSDSDGKDGDKRSKVSLT